MRLKASIGRAVDRAIDKARDPKVQLTVRLMFVAAGFGALRQILEDYGKRLASLEERGLVPIDDLVTIRDHAKIARRVWVLEGEPGPDPALGILPPEPEEEPAPAPDLHTVAMRPEEEDRAEGAGD